MANQLTVQSANHTRRKIVRRYLLAVSGNYTPGGDPIDFTNVLNPGWHANPIPGGFPVPSINDVKIEKSPAGYNAEIVAGTGNTLSTFAALKVSSAPGQELAAGAYPAALTGDPFLIEVTASTFGG